MVAHTIPIFIPLLVHCMWVRFFAAGFSLMTLPFMSFLPLFSLFLRIFMGGVSRLNGLVERVWASVASFSRHSASSSLFYLLFLAYAYDTFILIYVFIPLLRSSEFFWPLSIENICRLKRRLSTCVPSQKNGFLLPSLPDTPLPAIWCVPFTFCFGRLTRLLVTMQWQ